MSTRLPGPITENQQKMLEEFTAAMRVRSERVLNAWNEVQYSDDPELTSFIVSMIMSGDQDAIRRFEMEVFINGTDPRAYMKRHHVIESTATIDLGCDIVNKPTVFVTGGLCPSTSKALQEPNGQKMVHPELFYKHLNEKRTEMEARRKK